MNTKSSSLRSTLALAAVVAAAGLAATTLQAQTVNATGSLSGVSVSGAFNYTLTVQNTGSLPLEGFWYGWIPGVFDLPGTLSNIASTSGWTATQDPNGGTTWIMFQGGSGNAIPVGGAGTFTFTDTATPAQMTTSPADESVVYSGTISFTGNTPTSEEMTPTLSAVPEPSTVGLLITGALGFFGAGWRKFRA